MWDVGELWRSGELESGCFRGCTIRSSCNFPSISSRSRLVARALLYPPPYVCFFFSACTHSVILSQAAKVREMDPAEISQD